MQSVSFLRDSPFLILFLLSAQAMSQPEREATTAQVVATVGEQARDHALTLHFEATMDGETIGFSRSTLSASGSGRSGSLRYQTEMFFSGGDGTRIEGSVTATLNTSFEPTEVELRREVTAPNGNRQSTIERAKILDNEVLLTREADSGARTERNVPRPKSPFVLAVEFIVPQIDPKRFQAFALREFDPQEGKVIIQHFRAESESWGIRKLVSREDDGSIGYVFEVNAKGELLSWEEPPLPVVSTRCSRERFEEIRQSIGGR